MPSCESLAINHYMAGSLISKHIITAPVSTIKTFLTDLFPAGFIWFLRPTGYFMTLTLKIIKRVCLFYILTMRHAKHSALFVLIVGCLMAQQSL